MRQRPASTNIRPPCWPWAAIQRSVAANVVVDHEVVTRTFPEGPGTLELVCIYVVEDGLIQTASFVFGETHLD